MIMNHIKDFMKHKQWGQIITDFAILLVSTLLPTFFLLIWGGIKGQFYNALSTCYTHGEFLLYSVALVASSFVILRSQKVNTTLNVLTLTLVAGFYSIVMIASMPIENQTPNDNDFIFWLSTAFFVISMLECFISLCIQYTIAPDARENNQNVQNNIEKKLK